MTRASMTGLRRLLATVAAAAVAVGPLLLSVPPARAVDQPVLSVALTSITARGTGADDRVVVKATITNSGTTPAYGVQAMLWRSQDPISNLPTLREAAEGTSAWGSAMMGVDQYKLITLSTVPFNPGETTTVRLRATMAELGFTDSGVAYTLGVQAIGTGDQSSNYVVLGEDRSFLPVPGRKGTPVTSAVVLSAPTAKLVDGLFSDDSLATELAGPLEELLEAAEAGRSYIVDAGLIDAVEDMADGYQVVLGDTTVPGTGVSLARGWLTRLERLDPERGARSLFGSPDLLGAATAGSQDALGWSLAATDSVEELDDLPLVALPSWGQLTEAGYASVSGEDELDAVVATNPSRAGAWQQGSGTLDVLAASSTLAAVDGPATLHQLQQLEAEAAIAGKAGQLRLVTDPAQLDADEEATADWMTTRDLADLLDSTATTRQATFLDAQPVVLAANSFSAASRLERDFAAYGELVPGSDLTDQAPGVLARAVSLWWLDSGSDQAAYLRALTDRIGAPALARSISLDASARFVMSAKRNEFPVTITNKLDEAIRVKVRVSTDYPQRLTVPDSDVITIEAGESQTVNIRPQAESNGVSTAHAWLATENGSRVTPDTSITIEVTDLGLIGWVIVVGSGVVVLGATALRVRQVRRKQAADGAHG